MKRVLSLVSDALAQHSHLARVSLPSQKEAGVVTVDIKLSLVAGREHRQHQPSQPGSQMSERAISASVLDRQPCTKSITTSTSLEAQRPSDHAIVITSSSSESKDTHAAPPSPPAPCTIEFNSSAVSNVAETDGEEVLPPKKRPDAETASDQKLSLSKRPRHSEATNQNSIIHPKEGEAVQKIYSRNKPPGLQGSVTRRPTKRPFQFIVRKSASKS